MAIDSVLLFVVMRGLWHWPAWLAACILGLFLVPDLAFFSANALKILHGGWFPLLIGIAVFVLLSTWQRGRQILFQRLRPGAIAVEPFLDSIKIHPPTRVPGTAVFMTTSTEGVPHALLHNLNHNKVLHERNVLLTVATDEIPRVPEEERIEVQPLGGDFFRVKVRYGFKDDPDIPRALQLAKRFGLEFNLMETSFFLSRETLIPTVAPGMALWRERLFVGMARNAGTVTGYFKLPTNRVVELGTQIEL